MTDEESAHYISGALVEPHTPRTRQEEELAAIEAARERDAEDIATAARLTKVMQLVLGKEITGLRINLYDNLCIALEGGFTLELSDEGQSCCEHRYMHTDDDLPYYVGSLLQGVRVATGPDDFEGSDVKESQFLIVTTSKGEFTVVNYNEHNGYYGGFILKATISE